MDEPILMLGRSDIAGLLSFEDYVSAVEAGFRDLAEGRATSPSAMHVPGIDGGFHIKAAGLPFRRPYVAVKLNGNFPHNRRRFGLPTIQGVIMLCDGERGTPLAIMDSIEITIGRTGAATALGARLLAREDSQLATICGCGEQGRIQVTALCHELKLRRVYVHDVAPGAAASFACSMAPKLGIDIVPVCDPREALRRSDVVATCTTSTAPFVGPDDISPGTFIAAVGADNPSKQELQPGLMARAKVVVDLLDQCAEVGDLHHAITAGVMQRESVYAELGDLVAGRKPGRTTVDEITILDTTGTAVQDVAAAAIAYERALETGRGRRCDLS